MQEDFNIHTDMVQSRLRDQAFMLKIINKTTFSIQLENDFAEDTLKNVFINHIKKSIKEADNEEKSNIYKRALKIGLCALNGERIDFDED
ncbi:MAG: hypothetical protein MJA31_08445 [Clostridia bacterium]|nr:hypothetical protein [Clostridia bacterium]